MSFLKKLLLADYQEPVTNTQEVKKEKETIKFPSNTTNTFNTTTVKTPESHVMPNNAPVTQACEQHMGKLLDVYQSVLDKANMDGYDFFEFMGGILEADETGKNPLAYTMGFSMATKMSKSVTKDSLLQQADYYETEINKAHSGYVTNGNTKKQELLNQKENENQTLISDLNNLNEQLEAIKVQIADKQNKLNNIENKYSPQINEVECKLIANDAAKDKIISTIELVKNGIQTNIK